MGKYFGTDGIRGVANLELTPELAFKVGKAGAYVLTKEKKHNVTILVGMDTRLSCPMLESALTAGMCSVGAKVVVVSVVPTPSVAYLIRKHNFDAGVVISASHNPFQDNGIKFFNGDGYKLSDALEDEIEQYLEKTETLPKPIGDQLGTREFKEELINDYIDFLITTVGNINLSGLKIVVDCANGATYKVAPEIFKRLGAETIVIHNNPDGKNINLECGSTHIESLIEKVKSEKADIGIAYDGDGDRCMIIDEKGNLLDGDQILSICSYYMKEKGNLKNNGFVGTVMSNLGLVIMSRENNLKMEIAGVGDRYVLEEMLLKGYNLGGEQSGHIIFLDYNTTGDGILTSLQLLKIAKEENKSISGLNTKMKVLPQVMINAKVSNDKKYSYLENEIINEEIKKLDKLFSSNGRILIRASGTEPLVRVMIEGTDLELIEREAKRMAELIESLLS